MQSLLQIIAVGERRTGVSKTSGKPWEMQEAECILLNDDGTPNKVGVLNVPRELVGKVAVGTFIGSFALGANYKDRRIEAQLVGLQPYVQGKTPPPNSQAVAKASS
ncbi:hypothetical protein [Caldimonas sp. KR1-144]|uniref:hypothetical protein n=1 Tax=Caldimonas sp. KR1-144 TaxID=3400911 RepID=UPI003C0A9489